MEKNFVRIQSNETIVVTAGLQHMDVTNPDAHVPDRLKISPSWPKTTCQISQGVGVYPAYVAKWPTVKALAKDNILTIGEYLETADENAQKVKEELDRELKSMEPNKKETKQTNLEDLANEE